MLPTTLRSRLALLLVIANLPAAALAIGATIKGRDAEVEQRQYALVQKAELIATRAGLTLGLAEGMADALAANPDVASAGTGCARHLQAALGMRPEFGGVLVSRTDGAVLCAAGETEVSEDGRSALLRAMRSAKNASDTVFLPEEIPPAERTVLMSRPFTAPDGSRRAIGLLLRRETFEAVFLPVMPDPGDRSALALIRGQGAIVSEFTAGGSGEDWHPAEPLPSRRPGDPGIGMTLASVEGVEFFYAVAPVRGTQASVVLATPSSVLAETDWMRFATGLAAPLLMLLLGIFAVFAGVDQLVLRWIARLRQVAAAYARGDYSPRIGELDRAPLELAELGTGINTMAERIQERSTALEEALDGKNALLRELHHRVKNNFQMIASLLALQRRELPQRLRTLLRVPEDRVLAMAAAYKASYATGEIGHVSALDLLRDIAGQLRQSFGLAVPIIHTSADNEPAWLDLDQAVPLGLLVSEILSAALEREDAATSPVDIAVSKPDPGMINVTITSRGIADSVPTTGLAARLVSAYRAQINAALSTPADDTVLIAMPLQGETHNHPGRVELGA